MMGLASYEQCLIDKKAQEDLMKGMNVQKTPLQ